MTLIVDWIGGNCPVQAEGTIDGKRFYFRARGEHWSMEVHPTSTDDYVTWPRDDAEWMHEEEWGDEQYAAGWMPEDVALEMINKAAGLYRAVASAGA